jgi:hypothetical protein
MGMLKVMDRLNPTLIGLLQSSVHWVASPGLMLIRFNGRKTGRQYITPVGLNRFGNTVIIMVSDAHNRQWWRNFREPQSIELCISGQWLAGSGEVLATDHPEYSAWLERCFGRAPFMPKIFGVSYDKHQGITQANIARMEAYAVLVRVTLAATPHLQ